MKAPQLSQRQIEVGSLALLLLLLGFFFGWMFGVEPIIRTLLERRLGHSVYDLPELWSAAYAFVVGLLFPMVICFAVWVYAYYRWFIPNRTRLAREQISRLADARRAMMVAATYLESFEAELREKSAEAERLRGEVLSLQLLSAENVHDLERKLQAIESLKRNQIWFERVFAFVIGVASSLAATYFWEFLKRP